MAEKLNERRMHVRIPVSVGFTVHVTGKTPEFFYSSSITNFSEGGICIEWNYCKECKGFIEGEIHPDCIFSDYAQGKVGSGDLVFHIEIENYDKNINFKGKAVYTTKDEKGEKIGIAFTKISDEMIEFMKKVFA